jgi:hypothetical protein
MGDKSDTLDLNTPREQPQYRPKEGDSGYEGMFDQ